MLARWAIVFTMVLSTITAGAATVKESERAIPLAYDVDVVVVGGSLGAVSAAAEAAKAGARVFLAAPRPYLGEDVCGTYRLWLEPGEEPASDFEKALFASPKPATAPGAGLPFTYTADIPSDSPHTDTTPPSILSDGKTGHASTQSVQYNGDVTITADLGKETELSNVHLLVFQRNGDFETAQITVALSLDGQQWTPAGSVTNAKLGQGEFADQPIPLSVPVSARARYVKLTAQKTSVTRMLLGEIILEPPVSKDAQPADGTRVPPTPQQVKRVLDDTLLTAGVQFLYGCYPADLLRDASGQIAGIVMANRSGRQAVRAKCVIDVTPRAAVARMAGVAFQTPDTKPITFRRVILGPLPKSMEGVTLRSLPPMQISPDGGDAFCETYECAIDLPLADASYAALMAAEQTVRDRTWNPKQLNASEMLFFIPPDRITGKKQASGSWDGVDRIPVEAFQPDKMENLYVLGGCADLSRNMAEALLRPLAFLRAGVRLGQAAGTLAQSLPAPESVRVAATTANDTFPGEVREVLTGVRPTQRDLPAIPAETRSLPVLGDYDVVVVGGGTGGAPAGISAARQGAKTLVLEYNYGLGGVGTLGLIGKYYYGFLEGFTAEVDEGVKAMGGQDGKNGWNVETKMEWYRNELRKAGAELWFGAIGCGSLMEGNRVTGVIVATPEGRGVVRAKSVIDATGNSDIAFASGAACMTTGADHLGVQGSGMPPRKPGANYTNTDYTITDDADVVDSWRTFLAGRSKYPDAFDLAVLVDSRERRRIVGDFIVSPLDIWNKRTYPDSITLSRSNFDTHGFTVHMLFALQFPDKEEVFAFTPYRALLPKNVEGILVTGLGISAHRDAMPILRMQPDIQNQGYAAGVAAAMAASAGITPRQIDVKALQKHLVEKGNLPTAVLTDSDSYPMAPERIQQAVQNLINQYDGVSILLTQPDTALPLLRSAYTACESEENRSIYAHVLGMMGDPSGAEQLLKDVTGQEWDQGWSFTGGGQFGTSFSPLDSKMVALARTRDPRALEIVLKKIAQLDASREFSHHRAAAIALETLGQTEAAPALAELLSKPGMAGFACTDIDTAKQTAGLASPNLDRDRSIRELLLARALYRCGDDHGLAERILKRYAQDVRGHFARHAQAILSAPAVDADAVAADALNIEIQPQMTPGK